MKIVVVAALLALSFTTGFTCSKNSPTEGAQTEEGATQGEMAAPTEETSAEGEMMAAPTEGTADGSMEGAPAESGETEAAGTGE